MLKIYILYVNGKSDVGAESVHLSTPAVLAVCACPSCKAEAFLSS